MIEDLMKKYMVLQKSYHISLKIHEITQGFPQFEKYELASQLRRASKSVTANLVEGLGKNQSENDKKRYVTIAIGSNDETKLWLLYARDLGYLSPDTYKMCQDSVEEVGRMLYGLSQKLGA